MREAEYRQSQKTRAILALAAGVGSAMLFGFGLAAPLTPSYGCPTALDLVVFASLPTVLAATGALATRGAPRGVLMLQALVVVIATVWLLEQIGCLS